MLKIKRYGKVNLTEKEFDLIMTIRNYKNSYPNGYPEIRWHIEKLFNELIAEAENELDDITTATIAKIEIV